MNSTDVLHTKSLSKIISRINNYRWSITCIDMLPEYMKLLYQGVLDIYKEMEEIMGKEGKAHHLSYAKESVSCDIINWL